MQPIVCYIRGAFLSDQQNLAAAPAATHPTILKKSPSMMLIKSAERLTKPHSPANRVNIRLHAKPMTFIKVFDTIAFILIDLNILPSSVLMALNIADAEAPAPHYDTLVTNGKGSISSFCYQILCVSSAFLSRVSGTLHASRILLNPTYIA